MLRLRLGPASALEIADEGPALGVGRRLIARFERGPGGGELALGRLPLRGLSRLQRARSRDRALARDPILAVQTFDEVADAEVWAGAAIPGAPTPSPSIPTGPCSRRARSTTSPSSRACSRPPSGAAPRAAVWLERRSVPEPARARVRVAGAEHLAARVPAAGRRRAFRRSTGERRSSAGRSDRATPRPTTSAATPTRPAPARTRPACRGSTRTAFPLRASDGRPIDNLGRPVDRQGPARSTTDGELLRDPDGRPLPPAPRTGLRRDRRAASGSRPRLDGAWYRCCGGHVRKLTDCCAYSSTRINGDAALTGYCYAAARSSASCTTRPRCPC